MKDQLTLAQIREQVETAIARLPGEAASPSDAYDRIESVCIAELDAFHESFIPGQLESYLFCYLELRRYELGLVKFPEEE